MPLGCASIVRFLFLCFCNNDGMICFYLAVSVVLHVTVVSCQLFDTDSYL